jgi:hypothetical protein
MSLSVNSSPSVHPIYSNQLVRKTRAELEKIQRKIEAIENPDPFVNQVIDWKARFSKDIETINPFIKEMEQLLDGHPLLTLPIQHIDARHELLEALIAFTRLHVRPMPNALMTAAKQIQVLRLATPLTEEKRQRIEEVRAKKAAEEAIRAQHNQVPSTIVHTFREIELKAEQDVLSRMQHLEQLEQQMQTVDVQDLLEAIAVLEQGNHDLQQRLGQAYRAIPVLDRLLNPFRPVEEGEAAVSNVDPAVIHSALRRRLRAEMSFLNHKIQEWGIEDDMTKVIKIWGKNFWDSLNYLVHEESILKAFIEQAQTILIEPLYGTPMDEEALYGSDGYTYGKMAHELWQSEVRFLYRNRSPKHMDNPERLILKPHPVVRYLTSWLRSHDALLVSEKLLKDHADIPLKRQRQVQENKKFMMDHSKRTQEAEDQDLLNKLAAQEEQLYKDHRPYLDLKDKNFAVVAEQIERSTNNLVQVVQDQNNELEQLEDELQVLNENVTQLAVGVSQHKEGTSEVERGTQQLAIAIEETKIAIKKMHKKRNKAMIKTAVAIAACAAASWAGAALAPHIGLESVTVAPMSGGATLGTTFTF